MVPGSGHNRRLLEDVMSKSVDRRGFLAAAGLTVTGGALAAGLPAPAPPPKAAGDAPGDWAWVRDQFAVARDRAHFASFFITSHPRPVRDAIEALRRQIDENPFDVVEHGLFSKPDEVRAAAARYLGGTAEEVALTRSTTEGLALVYAGLALKPQHELLTTAHDHYSHHESVRLAAQRSGAAARRVALYDDPARAAEDEMADRLRRAIGPKTRAVGVTWVHSSTGVKVPVRRMADVVAEANRGRAAADRVLLIVDGVHGIGVEDETVAAMGCDFFAAGTHKWIFGPRGTGIVWGRKDAWAELRPTVPSFEEGPYEAWMAGREPGPTRAAWMSPGGFHAYEHLWALPAAFAFHERIGRARIAARIHELNARIKDGLKAVRGAKVLTPRDERLSSGLVAFEVAGRTPEAVVKGLAARRIVASTSPYSPSFARLAGSLLNTPEDVDAAVAAVAEIAAAS
jgi:selenocysteine lyase/cysteine desulfurase